MEQYNNNNNVEEVHDDDDENMTLSKDWINKMVVSSKGVGEAVDGQLEKRRVSVKRSMFSKEAANDSHMLTIGHEDTTSILRYYCSQMDEDEDIIYSCVECFFCNFEELLHLEKNKKPSMTIEENDVVRCAKDKGYIALLKEVVHGIDHLHSKSIIHRDLHPDNIMVVWLQDEDKVIAKIGNLRSAWRFDDGSTQLENSNRVGWRAPEQLDSDIINVWDKTTTKVDMFNLGILMYYTLTDCEHPFGFTDNIIHQQQPDLSGVSTFYEASHLITDLLQVCPASRPSAAEVLKHPLFWTPDLKLELLEEIGSRVVGWSNNNSPELQAITDIAIRANATMRGIQNNPTFNWAPCIHPLILTEMNKKTNLKYIGNKLEHFLRFVRNMNAHWPQLIVLSVFKQAFPSGTSRGDLFDYFDSRFPHLFMDVYQMAYDHCRTDPLFYKFF